MKILPYSNLYVLYSCLNFITATQIYWINIETNLFFEMIENRFMCIGNFFSYVFHAKIKCIFNYRYLCIMKWVSIKKWVGVTIRSFFYLMHLDISKNSYRCQYYWFIICQFHFLLKFMIQSFNWNKNVVSLIKIIIKRIFSCYSFLHQLFANIRVNKTWVPVVARAFGKELG